MHMDATRTLTLTEFLLARIAFDASQLAPSQFDNPQDDMRIHWADVGAISEVLLIGEARLRAECEAKRQIVELFPHAADGDGWNNAGEEVLLRLAAVYADHPDYDKEWKP